MRGCRGIAPLYSLYIYDDVTDAERHIVETHISKCKRCAGEVHSLQETLQVLRAEPEVAMPQHIMDNFEADVYRRIAAEIIADSNAETMVLPRRSIFTELWEHIWIRPSLFIRATSITIALGTGILIGASQFGAPQFSRAPEMVEKGALAVVHTSPAERLEKHVQTEYYQQLENALLTRYVARDEFRAMEIFNRLGEEDAGLRVTSVVSRERSTLQPFKSGI